MARILVLGGGVCGLSAGLMLARDGHAVTLLERDAAPVPDSPERAWADWCRAGVPHFKQPHGLQPLARTVLERELPDVVAACLESGATIGDPLDYMPPTITDRAPRPGDERFRTLQVRRPVLEQALARIADAEPGLTVRRRAGVARLLTQGANGSARVIGVRTDGGAELAADLVVDAMGRGSRLPRLLAAAGLEPGADETVGAGFAYYSRYFRGAVPAPRAPRLTHLGSFSVLTLTGDSDTWSVTLYAAAADRPLKRLRHADAFTAVVRALPRHAHWLEGEPLTGVLPMGGVIDRLRPAAPRTPGVLSVGDAWACTNPTLGRGIAVGLVHVALLRDVVRERFGDGLEDAWRERTDARARPLLPTRASRATADGSPRWRRTARGASRPCPRRPPRRSAPRCRWPWAATRTRSAPGWRSSAAWRPRTRCSRRPGPRRGRARPGRLGAAAGARARRPAGPDRRLSRPARAASVVSPRGCAAGSRSRATSRCRCRARACRTASTARSRRISRTCTRRTRSRR